jgi:hypothetical protein
MRLPWPLVLLAACSTPAPPNARPYGVQIFAVDTVTARLSVSVTGDLQLTLRGDDFQALPGRRFAVSTPASIVVTRGVGTATITSTDSVSRVAVVPIGTPDDSIEAVSVAGTVVKFTRLGYEQGRYRLSVDRP